MSFSSFNNRYAGRSCHVIGRGRTEFDYESLVDVNEPVFFINDAVCLEKHARSETFFFAHDPQLLSWLDGSIRSAAVLPQHILHGVDLSRHAGPTVTYRWRDKDKEDLLRMTRNELALTGELYNHTGTIHSLLHFVWYCGFKRVTLIGCNGAANYDQRLLNRSGSTPAPQNYPTICKVQNLLIQLFNLEAVHIGTP